MNKKLVLGLLLTLLVLISGALIYRTHITHWMVEKYFAEKNIKIKFTVHSLNFSGISLSDILIEEKIRIEELGLHFKSTNFNLMNLDSFALKMDIFDIKEMKALLAKFSEKPSESNELSFELLEQVCEQIAPMSLNLNINQFFLKDKLTPLGLIIEREKGSKQTSLKIKGHLESSPFDPLFALSQWDYSMDSSIECEKDKIQILVQSLESKMKNLELKEQPGLLNKLSSTIREGKISVAKDDSLEISLPFNLQINGKYDQSKIHLEMGSGNIEGFTNLKSLYKGQWSIHSSNLKLRAPQKLDIDNLRVQVNKENHELFPLSGEYKVSGLNSLDTEDKILAKGLQIHGKFELENTIYRSSINLSDSSDTLQFKNGKILYSPKSKKLKLLLDRRTSFVQLGENMSSLLPLLEDKEVKARGKILTTGSMGLLKKNLKGHLKFSGEEINFSSKYAQAKGLSFKHSLLGYPSLSSAKDQSFKVDEIVFGPTLKDLSLKYQVNSLSDIKVDLLEANIEGAEIQASNFSVNASERTMENFRADVYKFSLEKALKVALGDSVTAEGNLEGHLIVEFDGTKPMAKGQLISKQKGWIRYRKPGSSPPDPNKPNLNPMDILESYLYDFYYDQLSIDFQTNDKYEMKMTLRTLGKNPKYQGGKPLKLNINLEQNLLAAFKAMMLTYNLPNKIKERIEKMGTK